MSNKKQHGIIFTTEMVNAILDGRKTQTRREINVSIWYVVDSIPFEMSIFGLKQIKCKYGNVGDELYVKEPFTSTPTISHKSGYPTIGEKYIYKSDQVGRLIS